MKTVSSRKRTLDKRAPNKRALDKRAFVLVVFAIVVPVAVYSFSRFRSRSVPQEEPPRPVTLGDVTVPPLAGWSQKYTDGLRSDSVLYKRKSATYDLSLTVSWQHGYGKASHAKTVGDLRKRMESALNSMKSFDRMFEQKFGKSSYTEYKPLRAATYLGQPAIVLQTVTRTDKGKTYEGDGTRFLWHGAEFHLSTNISHPSAQALPPQAKAELQEAQRVLQKAFEQAKVTAPN